MNDGRVLHRSRLWAFLLLVTSSVPPAQPAAEQKRVTAVQRMAALSRAQVWRQPPVAVERADLSGAHDGLTDDISCRFVPEPLGGTTPKFDCTLPGGEILRVKYGQGPERHGEVASTRLLSALGFGADRVTFVRRLRCYGCPKFPYTTMKAVEIAGAESMYASTVNYDDRAEFEWVAVERRFPGDAIETDQQEGWAWHELQSGQGSRGEDSRVHIDALRLMAAFIAHWDNKSENQRLVCLPGGLRPDQSCDTPFALIQDAGATFGPRKVDLEGWRGAPLWHDRAACVVTMKGLPYDGATFRPVRISEAGRQFLSHRLGKLSDHQIRALFSGARFDAYRTPTSGAQPLPEWVRVFKQRVRLITDGPPCSPT